MSSWRAIVIDREYKYTAYLYLGQAFYDERFAFRDVPGVLHHQIITQIAQALFEASDDFFGRRIQAMGMNEAQGSRRSCAQTGGGLIIPIADLLHGLAHGRFGGGGYPRI